MHVYASLTEFKNFIQENGATVRTSTTDDVEMLGLLESVSRRIDEWTARGSGFGPVTATRYFDTNLERELFLDDDVSSAAAVVTLGGSTLTNLTDYDLIRGDGKYGDPPYRRIRMPDGSNLGYGRKNLTIAGTWGYPVVTRVLTPTTAEALDASETEIDVSALTGISVGMTLLIESEQVYVRATTDSTTDSITVDRGVNGTTAAIHDTAKAITRFVYDARVVDACKRVALRRWRARDAGADGFDGGGQMGTIAPREGEDLILARTVGSLKIEQVA